MLRIWDLKKEADKQKAEGLQGKKVTSAQLRVQGDVSSLQLPRTMTVEFPNPDDLMYFRLYLVPDEGIYKGGHFSFTFDIPAEYPIEPPKVRCQQKIYHPNIDLEGAVCLNILREDWKPVLSLNAIVIGIQFLFLEPNQNDPLNRDAAASLQASPSTFASKAKRAMLGGMVDGESFDRVI